MNLGYWHILRFVFLVLISASDSTYAKEDIDEINKEIKILKNKQHKIEKSLVDWPKQRDFWIQNNSNIDGINSSIIKSLNSNEINSLKNELRKFHCIGARHKSIVNGENACPQVYSCNNVYDCPNVGSAAPTVSAILKKMGVPLSNSNPKNMERYNEMRMLRSRLFNTVDYESQIRKAEADLLSVNKTLNELSKKKKVLDSMAPRYKQACSKFLNEMDGKVLSNVGNVISIQNMNKDQAKVYIKELHAGMTNTEALPSGEKKIESYKNLRNLAEAISCNGFQELVKEEIKDLEKGLFASFEKSQNTDCKTVDQTDGLYKGHLDCTEEYLTNLPSSLRQLSSDAKEIKFSLNKKKPADILEQIAKDQIDNAVNNLAEVDATFDLGHNQFNYETDLCHKKKYSDNRAISSFSSYASKKCEKSLNTKKNKPSQVLVNCGGDRLKDAQEQFRIRMMDIVKAHQYSAQSNARDHSLKKSTNEAISEVSEMFPEIAPLIYSPTFISQAEVDLDDVEMEFSPSDCSTIKNGLKDALINNIKFMASPVETGKEARNIAKTSQKTKRYLRNLYENPLDDSLYSDGLKEIDEFYNDIPELRSFPRSDIYHLKSLLKFRPELRSHYMKEFEGNASIICHLFKSMAKDDKRDIIIEQETKFMKGIAKAVGTTVAIGSFFVNPALGYLLTGAALGTSAVSSASSISLLEKKLNDAKNHQGKTIDDCTNGLIKQNHMKTVSRDLIRKNCSDAVTAMMTASELKDELSTAYKMSAAESALYIAYLIRLGPQALESASSMIGKGGQHHHHFMSWKNIASKNLPINQRILESAKTIGHGDAVYGALKATKAAYYMANVSKISYVFSEPLRNGYYYATLEEKVHERLNKNNSNELSEQEYKSIQDQVKKQISSMTEKQIIASLNSPK